MSSSVELHSRAIAVHLKLQQFIFLMDKQM